MSSSAPKNANGYCVFNFFVPLRRGLRFEDGLTFRGWVTPHGGALVSELPVVFDPSSVLPLPDDPASGAIRARFLRRETVHPDIARLDDLYPRVCEALGREVIDSESSLASSIEASVDTIVQLQVSSPCRLGSDSSIGLAAEQAFDWALDLLQEIQLRHREITNTVAILATRENIPPVIFMDHMTYRFDGTLVEDAGTGLFGSGAVGMSESAKFEISSERLAGLVSMPWDRLHETLFQRFNTFGLDARESLLIQGDYRAAVLNAAIAVECLFDDVLTYLLWWERLTPEQAKPILLKPIYKKVSSEFGVRIGGLWSPKRRGVIADWHNFVARIRDRIIHSGYNPTRGEALRSIATMGEVRRFIGRVAVGRKAQSDYPHLPLLLQGKEAAKDLGPNLARAREWYTSPHDFTGRFTNWRSVTRRLRAESYADAGAFEPELDKCTVLTVVSETEIYHLAADVTYALVARVSIPGIAPREMDRLLRVQSALKPGETEVYSMVEFGNSERIRIDSEWKPMEQFMPRFDMDVPSP